MEVIGVLPETVKALLGPFGVLVLGAALFALWRELKSGRVELTSILKLHEHRIDRLEDKVYANEEPKLVR